MLSHNKIATLKTFSPDLTEHPRLENKTTVKDALNPYETFRIQPGLIGRAITFLETGTINAKDLSINGKSWRAILEPIKSKLEYIELSTYITAKRGLEKIQQGIEVGFSKESALNSINKFNLNILTKLSAGFVLLLVRTNHSLSIYQLVMPTN